MEYASEQEKVLDDEGGWVDTHHFSEKGVEEKISEMKLDDTEAVAGSLSGNIFLVFA